MRIPKGHKRAEVFEYEGIVDDRAERWSWRVKAANYRTTNWAGESFASKAGARRAAENTIGITFPEGQDWADYRQ
jgi:uncharacterized protein YegP (UPF0339 family)